MLKFGKWLVDDDGILIKEIALQLAWLMIEAAGCAHHIPWWLVQMHRSTIFQTEVLGLNQNKWTRKKVKIYWHYLQGQSDSLEQ